VIDSGGRPYDRALAHRALLAAHHKLALALDDEIELVLTLVRVRVLSLTGFEAVQAKHEARALKQSGFEELVRARADVIAVMREVAHGWKLEVGISLLAPFQQFGQVLFVVLQNLAAQPGHVHLAIGRVGADALPAVVGQAAEVVHRFLSNEREHVE